MTAGVEPMYVPVSFKCIPVVNISNTSLIVFHTLSELLTVTVIAHLNVYCAHYCIIGYIWRSLKVTKVKKKNYCIARVIVDNVTKNSLNFQEPINALPNLSSALKTLLLQTPQSILYQSPSVRPHRTPPGVPRLTGISPARATEWNLT